MSDLILAIDIGGSKLLVGLIDENGQVVAREKQVLPAQYDADFLLEQVGALAEKFMEQKPVAVGVTIPGLADAEKGIWRYAPFSSISDIPIADILSRRLGLPVFADNDVNVCAIGEQMYGICKEERHFLWMTVSNGIGGALVLNGEIFAGAENNAGEIGHFIVEEHDGNRCGCGRDGCLEAMASGRAIGAAYSRLVGAEKTTAEAAEAARKGDEIARGVFEQAGTYLGKAIATAVTLLNIQRVVLGGGVMQNFDLLQQPIATAIDRYVFRQANRKIAVEPSGLGYDAALIGCAALARRRLQRNKH